MTDVTTELRPLTIQEFGDLVGCSPSMASRIRHGIRTPSIDLMERIGVVFDIPITVLLAKRRDGSLAELLNSLEGPPPTDPATPA